MKKNIGIIFGGMSTEHDVSIQSAKSIVKYLDKEKYNITRIFISKDGDWYYDTKSDSEIGDFKKIDNIIEFLRKLDVIFPVLHGKYGEDGTIQGLFELINIPYVGCGVIASSIAMDKFYTKTIINNTGIKQARYIGVEKYDNKYYYIDKYLCKKEYLDNELVSLIEKELKYPMFVKPANSGSSIGIKKVLNKKELKQAIDYAFSFDKKIVIEEQVIGREIECAVLGNNDVIASYIGEIVSNADFYTYDAKYQSNETKTIIPNDIDEKLIKEIQEKAIIIFKAIDGRGLSRVDFFVNTDANEIYFNEINTLPGFTNISMYPKLWEFSGIEYSQLLDKIIDLAIQNKKSSI